MRVAGFPNAQLFGLLNALQTGDPTTDACLALALPVILTKAVEHLSRSSRDSADTWWSRIRFLSKRWYKRSISYTERPGGANDSNNFGLDGDSHNVSLIKAIKLYIHHHCHFDPRELDLELTRLPQSSKTTNNPGNNRQYYLEQLVKQGAVPYRPGMRPSAAKASSKGNATSTYTMLKDCSILQKPVQNKWYNLGDFDKSPVHLMLTQSSTQTPRSRGIFQQQDSGDEASASETIQVQLRSRGLNSIDTFVQRAYDWYLGELQKEESNDRFFFDFKGFEGRGSNRYPVFGKYKLSDQKTFESIFSRQCHDLLKLVDQFQHKKGKYNIPGYPHKLGLLLHGLRGTGKTSLTKALSHYTQRHIVNIPLSRVETNNQLMTLCFNQRYVVGGQGGTPTPNLSFDQVIFVFEDIDAATEVVKRRDATANSPPSPVRVSPPPPFETPGRFQGRFNHDNTTNQSNNNNNNNRIRSPFEEEDKLNLSGFLNVLDGVVDTPGRMIIMTSNHPEVLDPALIRPGRIDKQLELGYMLPEDVVAMLRHYYRVDLSSSDKARVCQAITGGGCHASPLELIPASVEQWAMEMETKDEMIAWLEEEREKWDRKYEKVKHPMEVNENSVADSISRNLQSSLGSALVERQTSCMDTCMQTRTTSRIRDRYFISDTSSSSISNAFKFVAKNALVYLFVCFPV